MESVHNRWLRGKEQHRELWQFIVDNPRLSKEDWPGWNSRATIGNPKDYSHCFACRDYPCYICPCWWGGRNDGTQRRVCMGRKSVYKKYLRAVCKGNYNLVRLYASRIRAAWVLEY